jgi:GTP-binding protein HflX
MPRDQALLVVALKKGTPKAHFEAELGELTELTRSAGGVVVGHVSAAFERPTSNFFISSGKVTEIKTKANIAGANLLIFNVNLSPVQGRNVERETGLRPVDRTGLIIDIFARRAQSRAGRLQVELAQLTYLLPRLVGQGVIMSRTGGGIGTRGPGEQKLEVDRRKIRDRIGRVKDELEKVKAHQSRLRDRRKKKDFPTVSIVGYTNAGKSTLLNALTGAQVFVEDKLFATLDPTTRVLRIPGKRGALLTDTVGFLNDLPHSLIDAFRATLDEVTEADLLIHVLDASSPFRDSQYESVRRVLEELKAHEKPVILALNKIDLLDENEKRQISAQFPNAIPISAKQKLNLGALIEAIGKLTDDKNGVHDESNHRPFN